MNLEGLIRDKFANFCQRYAKELEQLEAATPVDEQGFKPKPVKEWDVRDIIVCVLTIQPYWGFIEEGHWDALLEMAALSEHPVAEQGLMIYQNLTEGRRTQLHKYLAFFLHGVQNLSKNAESP